MSFCVQLYKTLCIRGNDKLLTFGTFVLLADTLYKSMKVKTVRGRPVKKAFVEGRSGVIS